METLYCPNCGIGLSEPDEDGMYWCDGCGGGFCYEDLGDINDDDPKLGDMYPLETD